MKNSMEIARLVKGLESEEISNEIFDLVKKDKEWMARIVKDYCDFVSQDVSAIRQLIHEFQHPLSLDDEEAKDDEKGLKH